MSLITRCPACQTMFKVVPDQLRISEGWVRCGQCAEIFNAAQNMVATDNAPVTGSPAPASPYPPVPSHQPPQEPSAGMRPAGPADEPAPAPADRPVPRTMPAQAWQEPMVGAGVAPELAAPARADQDPIRDGEEAREPAWHEPPVEPAESQTVAEPASARREAVVDDPAQAETPPPSFLRDDEGDSFWQRKPVRWVMLVLALGLAVALALQVILQERNRIAQLEPGTRSLLAALCRVARCDIGPLQQIDSIVIDGSSFGRVRGDNYRLGFSLRNTAPIDVAMPAIELSLTDTQDQALVRRVILPAEFGAPAPALAAGADWSANLSLAVRAAPNTDRIAGYRLLAFYP